MGALALTLIYIQTSISRDSFLIFIVFLISYKTIKSSSQLIVEPLDQESLLADRMRSVGDADPYHFLFTKRVTFGA